MCNVDNFPRCTCMVQCDMQKNCIVWNRYPSLCPKKRLKWNNCNCLFTKKNSKQALHKVSEKSNLELPCFFLPDLKEVPPSFRCSSCGGGHHIYSLIQFRFGIRNGIWPATHLFIFLWSFLQLTTKQQRTAACEVNPLAQHGGLWLPPHI